MLETSKHTIKLSSRESSHSACQSSAAVLDAHNLTLLICHSLPTLQELCATINLSSGCEIKKASRKGIWLRSLSKTMQLPQSRSPRNVWVPTHLLFWKASGTQCLFQCCWQWRVLIRHHQGTACGGERSHLADEQGHEGRAEGGRSGLLGKHLTTAKWEQEEENRNGRENERKRQQRHIVDVLGVFPKQEKQAREVRHIQRDRAGKSGFRVGDGSDGKVLCRGDGSFSDFGGGRWAVCGKEHLKYILEDGLRRHSLGSHTWEAPCGHNSKN